MCGGNVKGIVRTVSYSRDTVGYTQDQIDARMRRISLKSYDEMTESDWVFVNYINGFRCHVCVPEIAASKPVHTSNDPGFGQN